MSGVDIFATWIGIFLTIAILSFLYGDNPFYKLAEHLFVGVSVGFVIIQQYDNTVRPQLIARLMSGQPATVALYLVPLVLAVLLFARFVPKWGWLSHFGFAFVFGSIAGMGIPNLGDAEVVSQLHATMLETRGLAGKPWTDVLGAIFLVTGLASALVYFFFSAEHKGAVGVVARWGVWVLMIGFGAAFGLTVAGRISLAIGRGWYVLGLDRPPELAAQIHAPWITLASIAIVGGTLAVRARRASRSKT
ncbi:MAG: hypothetical protein AABZ30_10140 [Myxococcota bacterium]